MVLIHSGSPKGAERIASRWADHRKVPQIAFRPDWTKHAKAAPFKRKRCSVTLGIIGASAWVLFGCPVPRHQFVDAFLRPAVDEACQQIGKIGLRIDAVELAGLDQ
jgi:hypothetical protein